MPAARAAEARPGAFGPGSPGAGESGPALGVWPARAQLRPGEALELVVTSAGIGPFQVRVLDGAVAVTAVELPAGRVAGPVRRTTVPLGGVGERVGLAIEVEDDRGARATTAIDVAPHWSTAPRYGFFSEFDPAEPEVISRERADALLRQHINVVQFYDWMPSHHTLVSETDEFVDPLGRRLSHAVTRRKVALAHERGMAALGYGAIYGAEPDFALAHSDWLLYDGRRRPLAAGPFHLLDVSARSPWRDWIIGQYEVALERLGFDGIHLDSYGMPKRALSRADGSWHAFEGEREFPGFVEEACRRILTLRPDGGSIFNCVNAWPLESMTAVRSDAATYIEVWEPNSRYRDLYELVRRARTLRPDKAVILAAYLAPFSPNRQRSSGALTAFRLASAAIGASGGFHLIAGEGHALLTEAYYPTHGRLDRREIAVVQRYADFAARNTTHLHDPAATDIAWTHVGPTNVLITLRHPTLDGYGGGARPDSLWVVGREVGRRTILQLINLRGLATDEWNAEQPTPPRPIEDLEVRARLIGGVAGAWWDTPDDEVGRARDLPADVTETDDGRHLILRVPRVDVWTSVWWDIEDGAT